MTHRIDVPPCLCWHRDLRPDMIVAYKLESGVLWAVFRMCPVHGVQAIEPVAGVGMLERKTATADQAVAVEQEAYQ